MIPKEVNTLAEIYHQKTKYFREEIANNPRQLDWSSQPSPFKDYHSERKVDLTPYLPFQKNPFTGKPLSYPPFYQEDELGLGQISRLLYFTNGVTGVLQYPNGSKLYLRAAPTAGGLYPTEIYLAVRDIPLLENGIYNFQVKDHSLVPLWEGNFWSEFSQYCFGHEAIDQSRVIVIMTAVFWRSAWRYEDRAYRRILLDTGHVLGNLNSYAKKEGLGVYPISGFFDQALNRLLFLEEEKEGVLMMNALPLLKTLKAREIRRSSVYPSSLRSAEADLDSPLLLGLHQASYLGRESFMLEGEIPDSYAIEDKYQFRPSIKLEEKPLDSAEKGIEQTILERRSTRAYSGHPLFKDELSHLLKFAYEPAILRDESESENRGLPQVFDPSLLETYVIIHGVLEMDSGVYYYAPIQQELRLIRKGNFKQSSWEFCLGQELGRDASVIIVHASHLPNAVTKYGNRAYRYLHLDAGHIGQRLNLAAIQMGLGASGIGGFFDDEVNDLLQLSLEYAIVYITTIGRPAVVSG